MINDSPIKYLSSLEGRLKYVKAEFEAEGTRADELSILKFIVSSAKSHLVIKIGGSQAFRDVIECCTLETKYILVPMVETPHALQLFMETRQAFIEDLRLPFVFPRILINIETKTAVQNIDEILRLADSFDDFSGVVIGRSDLTASLGIPRNEIESSGVLDLCKDILLKSKARGFVVTLGGGITPKSYDFVMHLTEFGLDAFETRKCCFNVNDYKKEEFSLLTENALLFEQAMLNLYDSVSKVTYQDKQVRIAALESRKQ